MCLGISLMSLWLYYLYKCLLIVEYKNKLWCVYLYNEIIYIRENKEVGVLFIIMDKF